MPWWTVDIDGAMVSAARDWFCAPQGDQYRYHVEDAYDFVAKAEPGLYDYVLVDLFKGNHTPEKFFSAAFISSLKLALRKGGLGALNFSLENDGEQKKDLMAVLSGLFSNVEVVKMYGGAHHLIFFSDG